MSTIARSTSRSRPWWHPSLPHRNSNTLALTLPFRVRGWWGGANIDLTSATLICPNDTTTMGRRSQFAASLLCPPFDGTALRPARQESRRTRLFVPSRPRIQRFHSLRVFLPKGLFEGSVGQVVWIVSETLCSILWRRSIFQGMWTVVEYSLSGSIWG